MSSFGHTPPPAADRGGAGDGTAVGARAWLMLVLGSVAQIASATLVHGAAFLIPALRSHQGLGLAQAGLVVGLPTAGVMLTLIGWGALADAVGERLVLTVGLALMAAAGLGAARAGSTAALGTFLLLGGMAAASTNAASGRVVIGWFPPARRGLAMGLRQMAQPLGVGLGALTVPGLADRHGIGTALLVPAVLALLMAVACGVLVRDPPRPPRAGADAPVANPYRGSWTLWRIHGVSVLLVIPQFVVWTFMLVWLITDRGWSPGAAGVLVTLAQLAGAAGRVGAGWWSDKLGSRMRPLRTVAIAAALVMGLLAILAAVGLWVAIPVMVAATAVTVADNGLAFTAVAEIGGPYWAGRALGVQNTAQFLTAAAVPPAAGALIALVGYPGTFAAAALSALAAVPLVPRRDGRSARGPGRHAARRPVTPPGSAAADARPGR